MLRHTIVFLCLLCDLVAKSGKPGRTTTLSSEADQACCARYVVMKATGGPQKLRFTIQSCSGEVGTDSSITTGWKGLCY